MDLHLGGANFTWSNHQIPHSLSRLDRFFVTNDWMDLYPEVSQIALPKPTSDHCPILLNSNNAKWGPSPFRFELLWLEDKHFRDSIKLWWNNYDVSGRASYRLSSKLKRLKFSIKDWIKINHRPLESHKASILEELQSLDIKEEYQILSDTDIAKRFHLKDLFERTIREEEIKWKQRSRCRWLKTPSFSTVWLRLECGATGSII